jgi:hypothetical protein
LRRRTVVWFSTRTQPQPAARHLRVIPVAVIVVLAGQRIGSQSKALPGHAIHDVDNRDFARRKQTHPRQACPGIPPQLPPANQPMPSTCPIQATPSTVRQAATQENAVSPGSSPGSSCQAPRAQGERVRRRWLSACSSPVIQHPERSAAMPIATKTNLRRQLSQRLPLRLRSKDHGGMEIAHRLTHASCGERRR